MSQSRRILVGSILVGVGVLLIVSSPTNTPLGGWAMLLRAIGGQAALVAGMESLTGSKIVRRVTLLVTSIILFLLSLLALLMSKEGGESWALAACVMILWFLGCAIYAAIQLIRSKSPR